MRLLCQNENLHDYSHKILYTTHVLTLQTQLIVNARPTGYPVSKAETFWQRFTGLMGKHPAPDGLMIPRCNSIHTFFMRYAIDVIFIDGNDTAIRVVERLKPWRMTFSSRGRTVLELPGGQAGKIGITAGKTVTFL